MKRLLLASLALLAACGSDEPSSSPEPASDVTTVSDASALDATASDVSPTACPSGHILGPDGACMAVGIQGCDDMFIDLETGLCEPSLVDCPPGSIPIFGGEDQGCRAVGVVDCHPDFLDAETGRCEPKEDACPQGSMAIPTAGCVSLDPPGGCGEGTWGNIEELPGDVHLDLNYTGDDSDGSREKPWTLYGYAVGQVQPGGRIVFAAGDYDQGVLVSKSISLVGRCSSMVTIKGVRLTPFGPAILEAKGDTEAVLSGLTLSGPGYGVLVHSGTKLSMSKMVVSETYFTGLWAFGPETSLTVDEASVSRTLPNAEGLFGMGVDVGDGASVNLSRVRISDNHTVGILSTGTGTSTTVSEAWISGTRANLNGKFGYGVEVGAGGNLSLSRSWISESQSMGMSAHKPGSLLTASDVWVSDTKMNASGRLGYGVALWDGAQANLDGCLVSNNRSAGVFTTDPGTTLFADATWVSGTRMNAAGEYGSGISASGGSSVSVHRSRVTESHSAGIIVTGLDSSAALSEVWVSGTMPNEEGLHGSGVAGELESSLSVQRSRVSDNHMAGISFVRAQGTVIESLLENTLAGDLLFGDGLLVTGSVVTADRIIARDNARAGVLFDKSDGELFGSLITQNAVGLANQGLPGAEIADDNVFEGNDQDRLDDGDLEVPGEPMALPQTSGGGG